MADMKENKGAKAETAVACAAAEAEVNTPQLIGAVSQSQIDEWKRKFGKVFSYEVDGKVVYFKQPNRHAVSMAGIEAKTNPLKYTEILLKNSILGGAVEMIDDDSVFYGIAAEVDKLIDVKVGELKNL